MSSEPAAAVKRPRGGMAGLASNLTERAGSLARRSTEDGITPAVGEPEPVPETPAMSEPAVAAGNATRTAVPVEDRPSAQPVAPVRRSQPASATELPRPLAGPEGRLEASGEPVVKWTLELAPQLIDALNVWERDETKRLGQRVFRERMVDLALDSLPQDVQAILDIVAELPAPLRTATGQQFGTRVRYSVREKLMNLRPELRVAGIKNVRIRDIYSAGVYRYLTGLGIEVLSEKA